jgi:ribonuclease-3
LGHVPITEPCIRATSRQRFDCELRVTLEVQQLAEKVLGYQFKNPNLLKEALTHSSIADNRLDSNERMEFLGDAVLDLVVCEALYKKFPEYMEGDLTKIKSAVVSRRTCAEVSNETGLTQLLITGKGIHNSAMMPSSLAAAVYESITAAIYLDGGFSVVKDYVLRTMMPHIEDIASNSHHQNYKAVLQQHAQKVLGGTPMYELLDEKGPDHSKCFEVCVVIDGHRYNSAWGPNKKMAEQRAALYALEQLGVFDSEQVDKLLEAIPDMEGVRQYPEAPRRAPERSGEMEEVDPIDEDMPEEVTEVVAVKKKPKKKAGVKKKAKGGKPKKKVMR